MIAIGYLPYPSADEKTKASEDGGCRLSVIGWRLSRLPAFVVIFCLYIGRVGRVGRCNIVCMPARDIDDIKRGGGGGMYVCMEMIDCVCASAVSTI